MLEQYEQGPDGHAPEADLQLVRSHHRESGRLNRPFPLGRYFIVLQPARTENLLDQSGPSAKFVRQAQDSSQKGLSDYGIASDKEQKTCSWSEQPGVYLRSAQDDHRVAPVEASDTLLSLGATLALGVGRAIAPLEDIIAIGTSSLLTPALDIYRASIEQKTETTLAESDLSLDTDSYPDWFEDRLRATADGLYLRQFPGPADPFRLAPERRISLSTLATHQFCPAPITAALVSE
jgi:hypothetical protein